MSYELPCLCFAKASHAQEAFVVVNGHDSGNNGASNPNLTTIVDEFEKNISVIK